MPSVYVCQLDTAWHDPASNYAAARALIDRQTIVPGSLIVLPEMFDVGFSMDAATATAAARMTSAFLTELSRAKGSTIVAGHAKRGSTGNAMNHASVVNAEGQLVQEYVKSYLFSPLDEHNAYAPGSGPTFFEWGGLKVAPIICYDLRFPELFRAAAKLGAEMFVVIANWPASRVEHWVTLARARAIENQAYVVACNRCGRDPNVDYPGRSLVVDPKGEVISEAGSGVEMLIADIDPRSVTDWRRDFPALRDAGFS